MMSISVSGRFARARGIRGLRYRRLLDLHRFCNESGVLISI